MLREARSLLFIAAMTSLSGCSFKTLGPAGPAPNHRPYFEVFDGPGRTCDAVKLDGIAWNHPNGVPIPVSEGPHRFQCGDDVIAFAIPDGLIYKFDFR